MRMKGTYFFGLGIQAVGAALVVFGVVRDLTPLTVVGIAALVVGTGLVVAGVVLTARGRGGPPAPRTPEKP